MKVIDNGVDISLKPCPFCGGEVIFARDLEGEIHGIYCHKCKSKVKFQIEFKKSDTFGKTMTDWAEAWNRRATG